MNMQLVSNKLLTINKNSPAANGRFGATAALTPRKRQCVDERLSPA